ncbi:MOSC domain-containing protein [Alicyclobacillus dauci]|uniref:MOSC domain-containing protein n=1 Tax=Alicyclobacillus dauci TaxID=1475485 RepID=A0ABY6Z439_9BACL|nr:MOSC domain-containing protein [Alicyclobacillus dauci]WAH37647.1 MOSC domain-containing protein [Alicyclobacillus dauci]
MYDTANEWARGIIVRVISVQVGQAKTYPLDEQGSRDNTWRSAFDKRPVNQSTRVEVHGLVGDEQADMKHHGGPDKAVLLYAFRHYDEWKSRYAALDLQPGAFGENLTVESLDETYVCVGDVFRVGDVVLEIAQPRIPCWKISKRWREETLADAVRSSGKTGWYARVKEAGTVKAGDALERLHHPFPQFTIARLNDLLFHREPFTSALVDELAACTPLADAWKANLLRG